MKEEIQALANSIHELDKDINEVVRSIVSASDNTKALIAAQLTVMDYQAHIISYLEKRPYKEVRDEISSHLKTHLEKLKS